MKSGWERGQSTATIILIVLGIFVAYNILGAISLSVKKETISGKTGAVWNASQRAVEVLTRLENEVMVFQDSRLEIVQQITIARNDILAAQAIGDLEALNRAITAALSINLSVEAYPDLSLTVQQVGLMDETAGSINRIAYARSELIDSQVSFNQTRIFFFPVGLMFPRVTVLGEFNDPSAPLPPSTFGNGG